MTTTAADILARLEQAGCRVALDGSDNSSIRVRGPLTDDLRQAIRQHKPELLELLKSAPGHGDLPGAAATAYCFYCFKTYGKQARYRPHTVDKSLEFPGWLELTCTVCGSKCYVREESEEGGEESEKEGADA